MSKIFLMAIGFSMIMMADFSRNNSAQTVTESISGLQWQDDNDARTLTYNFSNAVNYCKASGLGNNNDWRLPNINELMSLVDYQNANPAIDSNFLNVKSDTYWSSTTKSSPNMGWEVNFDEGKSWYVDKTDTHYIRCVRAGY